VATRARVRSLTIGEPTWKRLGRTTVEDLGREGIDGVATCLI
jgi:hypothetical protein